MVYTIVIEASLDNGRIVNTDASFDVVVSVNCARPENTFSFDALNVSADYFLRASPDTTEYVTVIDQW